MKRSLCFILMGLLFKLGTAQTASNFTCNDCSGNNHDLFTELNSGKVIVIAWVMPCSNCISGALSAFTAAQNFASSNPGQVLFYLSDDYANTPCATLQSWANTNGIRPDAIFSNAAVSMTPYGVAGMPKVVVLGGSGHTVYYNANSSVNISTSGIQTAIGNALSAIAAGINENNGIFSSLEIFPNPSNTSASISVKLSGESKVKIEILDQLGQKISEVYNGNLSQGDNNIKVNTSELANGHYFISCSDGVTTRKIKLIVLR